MTLYSTGPVDQIVDVVTDALLLGDTTISRTGVPYAGNGILVGVPQYALKITGPATHARVSEWVLLNLPIVANAVPPFAPARYFGSWRDGGSLYLDVVDAFPAEQEAAAVAAGRERGELAVWHAGRQELILL